MGRSKKIPAEIQLILIQAMTSAAFICVTAYLSLWIFFSVWSGVAQECPLFFRVNTCIFALEAIATHHFSEYCKNKPYSHLALKQQMLTTCGILSGLHLGVIHAYLIYSGSLTLDEQYIVRIILTGFAGVIGSLWGIANLTGLFYAIAVILPLIPASYFFNDPNANLLTILSGFLWFFLYLSTRSLQRNSFLQFISNYRLTQVHADSMEHLSKKDIITKVTNRYHWLINFESLWKSQKQKNQTLCLIGIQIEHLSDIIEAHGHKTGDMIMTSVASLLQGSVDDPDLIGRYQCDQFMLAVSNIEYSQANQLARSIRKSIQEKLFTAGQFCSPVYLSTSTACNTQRSDDSAQSMVESVSQELQR